MKATCSIRVETVDAYGNSIPIDNNENRGLVMATERARIGQSLE